MNRPPRDATATFAIAAIAVATAAFALAIAGALGVGGGAAAGGSGGSVEVDGDDGAVADPTATADDVVAAAADAMGTVTSVEFRLARDGAPIYIDEFERIALDGLRGQFTVPTVPRPSSA
jgi:hypothetical protein